MSSLVFSIPSAAPASTSGAAPASAASTNATARGRDAKPAADADGFGAALARMRDARTRQSDDKSDAPATTPLARRRALDADARQKDSTPAELLAMAMLTPAFSAQAAQKRQAGEAAASGADAALPSALEGGAAAASALPLAGEAAEMAAADARPATDDKPAKTARAADGDAPAEAAADPKAAKQDTATPLPEPKTTAAAAGAAAVAAQAAPAAPAAAGGAAKDGKDGKNAGASPALAALDAKTAPESTSAQVQGKEPSVAEQIEGSSASDTHASLPAQLAFKTALAQAGGSTGNAAPAPSLPRFDVHAAVGSENWGADVGRQMIRMGSDGHHVAELNLNPAGLGPLKVTLSMGDGQAQALFVSAHESVRRAVEAALPQLRDTLAGQGIQLGQASVDAGAQQQQQQAFGQQDRAFEGTLRTNGRGAPRAAAELEAAAPVRAASSGRPSGIDTFA